EVVERVFEVCDRKWRGVGSIPQSGYRLRQEFLEHDAELVFGVQEIDTRESTVCISGEILKGIKKPPDCRAFGTLCTPQPSHQRRLQVITVCRQAASRDTYA